MWIMDSEKGGKKEENHRLFREVEYFFFLKISRKGSIIMKCFYVIKEALHD